MLALARRSAFASLASGDLRLLLFGVAIAYIADSISIFAISWLVVEIAGGGDGATERLALYLALVGLARTIPAFIVGPVAGAIVDRVDRRTVLRAVIGISLAEAAVLVTLTQLGLVTIGALLVLTFVSATVGALELPTVYSSVPRLVPPARLMSAIGLTNMVDNLSLLVGPLIGGVIVALFGSRAPFIALVPLYVVALTVVWRLSAVPPDRGTAGVRLLTLLRGGVDHIVEDRLLVTLMSLSTVLSFFGRAMTYLYPLVVTSVLHLGAVELSWLLAARAAGTLAGSLTVASLGAVVRRALAAGICLVVFGLALLAFALQRQLVPALLCAAVCGCAQYLYSGLANAMLQERTVDHARGRVLSVYTTTTSAPTWLGVLVLGAAASVVGIAPVMAAGGVILVLSAIGATAGVRDVRDYRARSFAASG